MPKKKQQTDYAEELQKSHKHWEHIYEHGCSDPFWSDGTNLNLIRNHIFYYQNQIEENFAPENYPTIYFKQIPPEIDDDYIARADEIRAAAKCKLEIYKADPNYNYIMEHRHDFTEKTQEKLYIPAVVGYVWDLENAIEEDDLVTMRRHENPESYLDSFVSCLEAMKNQPSEDVQMSFFSLSESLIDNSESDDSEELDMYF